ncbi:MAG: hypothetical protein C0610_09370 [Desulfobacteraceae bacterium]|nr:MAG: hypothetical protein C0610_09370 [Desulfobacteraceae bacterium]
MTGVMRETEAFNKKAEPKLRSVSWSDQAARRSRVSFLVGPVSANHHNWPKNQDRIGQNIK